MKIVLDNLIPEEIIEYLLDYPGIEKVVIDELENGTSLEIKYNNNTDSKIIYKYIELFLQNKFPIMLDFKKNEQKELKEYEFIIEDMCCEYCYKGLVTDLFNNEDIEEVKSNFSFDTPAFNIKFNIKYNANADLNKINEYIHNVYKED